MVKSVNLQLKSKDIDIQRLNIKIKRLEKSHIPDESTSKDTISPTSSTQMIKHP